jgi:hypothetical protein
MATAPARRVIARTPRRPAAGPRSAQGSGFAAECRWCRRSILWLRSTATDLLAPIDAAPAPGGNVIVARDELGRPTGAYDVAQPPRPRPAAPEQASLLEVEDSSPYADLGGGLEEVLSGVEHVPEHEMPTRHWNHWATCSNVTARNMAKRRQATGAAPGPLRTVDGDPVNPRHVEDALAPPAAVAANLRRCRACWQPLDATLSAAGARFHPTCGPDPGPEPDRD